MKTYLTPDGQGRLVKIGASGFTPANSIAIPDDLAQEDERWLKVVEIKDSETDETTTVIQVDEDLKAQALAERAQRDAEAKAQETARILAREERITRSKANSLRTLEDLRQAVEDILDHLGMK